MKKQVLVLSATAAMLLAGCTTNPYTGESQISRTAGGAVIGAGGGALGGALIGSAMGDGRAGALIGAGIGALAGGAVGNYMDQQEAELRAKLQGSGVSVTRVGDNIVLNMPSNITFGVDQSNIQPQFRATLESVALVLEEFDQTLVDIIGYTDSTGSDSYNLTLSQQRATSVARTLSQYGVDSRRFFVEGRGKSNPIADNSTEAGRAQNRRVEIRIIPLRN